MVRSTFALVVFATAFAGSASGATVPFTEDFGTDAANWYNGLGVSELDWVAAGGPDGSGYVTGTLNIATANVGDTPTVFRGQDEFGSSGNAFVGNYLAEGVEEFRAMVRHNAPFPLTFFVRFSGPGNFPGAVAANFVPVFPNTWTELVIPINGANPQFISFEGQTFEAVFSNIGHIQIGASVGEGQAGYPLDIVCDLDKPTITGAADVPAVSTWGLVILAMLLAVAGKLGVRRVSAA